MSKAVQALLSGIFFTFILDFFLFLGIKFNYIDKLGIEIYYNVLFADHQNFILFFLISIIIGWLIVYSKNLFFKLTIMTLLFILALSTLLEPIGFRVGKALFMRENVTLHNKKFTFRGDIYYIGRKKITFHDKELNKTILLNKDEIVEDINEL